MNLKAEIETAYDNLNIEEATSLSDSEKMILKGLTTDLVTTKVRMLAGDTSAERDLEFIETSIANVAGIGFARAHNLSQDIMNQILTIALKALI